MPRALRGPIDGGSEADAAPVVLVVVLDRPSDRGARAARADDVHDKHARLVRALLSESASLELDEPYGDACLLFASWTVAVEAALALPPQLRRLGHEFGITMRSGLELVEGVSELAAAQGTTAIAAAAGPGEIRLGASVAGLIERNPPPGMVVRAVESAATGRAAAYVLLRARDTVPNNLVETSTTFLGRQTEIAELELLIDRAPLITITGPPGTGKSRLAGEIAERLLGRFDDGAWFVPLAAVTDPALVMSAVAVALAIPVAPGVAPADAVNAHLRDRRLLLVLDNLEHVLAARSEIADLLAASRDVSVIATSQTVLGIRGEVAFGLAPLSVPAEGSSLETTSGSAAVRLFDDRATAAQPTFHLGVDDVDLAADVCRRLDGLPLAIELVAARIRLLPLTAIRDRLDARLGIVGDRFDEPARHHSLRAAVGWSYDLLDPPVRALFRRLSVFRGGWTIEGATAVSDDAAPDDELTVAGLAALRNASLLDRIEGATPRFAMLETLRQFGAEQLEQAGETGSTQRNHSRYYLELASQLGPSLTGPDQAAALDQLSVEHDNVRAALAELLDTDPVAALRLGARIWRFWQMRGHLVEGSRWITSALSAAAATASPADLADGRAAAGGIAYWRSDLDETERHYQAAAALRRTIGEPVPLGDALFDLAFVYDPALRPPPEDPERTAEGIRIAEEAHALYRDAGHEPGIAKSEWLLGSIVANRDIGRAMALLGSSVDRFRQLGDPFGLGWALHSYGLTLLRSTDSASASAAFAEALGLFSMVADGSATALLLDDFAEVAKVEGDALRAARLRGAASSMRRSTEAELAVTNAPWLGDDAVPRGLIDPLALERAWAEGQAMTQSTAIGYALRAEPAPINDGLRISALGPLIVERSGEPVTDWGGPKAGSRHALAIFAFLMDRGERGVTKDEFVEVVWPDAGVEQGDLSFHRTLGGLRSTLARQAGNGSDGEVVFANGRYRLAGSVVGWLDVAEFQQRLLNAAEATDDLAAIRGLESARQLYRGDYLDDCPLYGDSEYVEERRGFLRGRLVDALVDLGRRYEGRHDDSLASERFREALSVAGGNCPSAVDGLRRLGVAAT